MQKEKSTREREKNKETIELGPKDSFMRHALHRTYFFGGRRSSPALFCALYTLEVDFPSFFMYCLENTFLMCFLPICLRINCTGLLSTYLGYMNRLY